MELVGLSEVAELAGVSRQAVVNWRSRFNDFPSPTTELASGPVWERESIMVWLKKRESSFDGTTNQVTGSGKNETRTVGLSGFDRLELSSVIAAEIIKANEFSVAVSTDDNVFDYVDFIKTDNTLEIKLKSGRYFQNIKVNVIIQMPELQSLKLSGAARASVSGFDSETFSMAASGASKIRLDNIRAGDTSLKASGASSITGKIETTICRIDASGASILELEGKSDELKLELSGASKAHLAGFNAGNVEAKVSGASGTDLTFTGKLDAEASGVSHISYAGEGTLGKMRVKGVSSLQKRQQ